MVTEALPPIDAHSPRKVDRDRTGSKEVPPELQAYQSPEKRPDTANSATSTRPTDDGQGQPMERKESKERKAVQFDVYTLRQWFMEMDRDSSGHVTKEDFFAYLDQRPALKQLFVAHSPKNSRKPGGREVSQKEAQALEMRRLLKVLREIDEDKNGTLEWEEFIEFFKRSGYLLEYSDNNNPRVKMAECLGQIHDAQMEGEDVDDKVMNDLRMMSKEHASTNVRRKSQDLANGIDVSAMSMPQMRRRASAGACLDATSLSHLANLNATPSGGPLQRRRSAA